jgi:methylated-DNA-[protein]-cysteine S-methyltransferase
MGQSLGEKPRRKPDDQTCCADFTVFNTACGWMGLIGQHGAVQHLRLGYDDPGDLRKELVRLVPSPECLRESDWYPALRERLQAYAAGQPVSFAKVRCDLPPLTEFQRRVLDYVRHVPFGKVVSYGDVARAVGAPRAARAVGTVMSTNRIPIIIPCHRVVAAGGKLGGYTSPRGTDLKQWLLDLERAALPRRPK